MKNKIKTGINEYLISYTLSINKTGKGVQKTAQNYLFSSLSVNREENMGNLENYEYDRAYITDKCHVQRSLPSLL